MNSAMHAGAILLRRLALQSWLCLIIPLMVQSMHAQQKSRFIRKTKGSQGAIVFVHGLIGDGEGTWTSSSGQYWPALIAADHAFDSQDIYVVEYPTYKLARGMSINELADYLNQVLKSDGIYSYSELSFVSHSMGGLVTRELLLKYRENLRSKVRMLFFLATPTNGSPFAKLASAFSRNPQFDKLAATQADAYLADVTRNWQAAHMQLPSYCAYETETLAGQMIVDLTSASALCTEPLVPVPANHIEIAKPTSIFSVQHQALRNAFIETQKHHSPDGKNSHQSAQRKSQAQHSHIDQRSYGPNSPNIVGNNNQIVYGSPRPQPRHLSSSGVNELVRALRPFKGTRIEVDALADGESDVLGDEIVRALVQAGWSVDEGRVLTSYVMLPPIRGVLIRAPNPRNNAAAGELQRRLTEILKRQVDGTDAGNSEKIYLMVGNNG